MKNQVTTVWLFNLWKNSFGSPLDAFKLAVSKAMNPNEIRERNYSISRQAIVDAYTMPNFGGTIRSRYQHFYRSLRQNSLAVLP